jgi:hypothetical protein
MSAYITCGDIDNLLQECHISCDYITLLFYQPFWKNKIISEVLTVVTVTLIAFFLDVTSTSFVDK